MNLNIFCVFAVRTVALSVGEVIRLAADSLVVAVGCALVAVWDPLLPEVLPSGVVLEETLQLEPTIVGPIAVHEKFKHPSSETKTIRVHTVILSTEHTQNTTNWFDLLVALYFLKSSASDIPVFILPGSSLWFECSVRSLTRLKPPIEEVVVLRPSQLLFTRVFEQMSDGNHAIVWTRV